MKKDAEIAFRSYLEKNPNCTLTEYQTPNGIETVLIKQNGTDSGQGVLQLIAKARDDALIYLWFEVAEELSEQWDVCENYLMRILDTIQFGDRLLTVQKRTEALLNMDIDIAEGYVLSCQWGVDFETYYIQKMAPIDQPCVYMGIYHGEHPSYSEKLEGYPASQIKKTKGTILGKDITWLHYGESTVNAKSYLQTLVPDADYWMLHIFIIPSNQDNMEEMRNMACSLRYAAETNQNDTETAEVPADGYFRVDEENGINAFHNERYSEKLAAMEEPVLSAEAQTKQTYRLLSCPSFAHPYCIRVEVDSDQTSGTLFYKILSGGGDNPGQIARSFERKLEKQDVERILSQIEKSDFWNLPTTVDKSGLDGTAIVFEGVQSGKYHVAERWTPDKDDPIYQLITLFIELARERVAVSE